MVKLRRRVVSGNNRRPAPLRRPRSLLFLSQRKLALGKPNREVVRKTLRRVRPPLGRPVRARDARPNRRAVLLLHPRQRHVRNEPGRRVEIHPPKPKTEIVLRRSLNVVKRARSNVRARQDGSHVNFQLRNPRRVRGRNRWRRKRALPKAAQPLGVNLVERRVRW